MGDIRTLHRVFGPIRTFLPPRAANFIRSFFTALLTPVLFSYRTGHFLSSWRRSAVSRRGIPVPWYTYPCIDFLKYRNFADRRILEFGGGQSTLWWAQRAKEVVTMEGDPAWHDQIRGKMPTNVQLHLISMASPAACVDEVNRLVQNGPKFDLVIIDGLFRRELVPVSLSVLAPGGALLCDNSETYSFYDTLRDSGLNRVDFFGHAPGVVLPHCTSLFFQDSCFLLSARYPIPTIAADY